MKDMSRWQQGRIKGDELKCAEWAKETLESRSDGGKVEPLQLVCLVLCTIRPCIIGMLVWHAAAMLRHIA